MPPPPVPEPVTNHKPQIKMSITKQELHGGIACIVAVAEAVRESKRVPAGTLYATVMAYLDLASFEKVISILKKAHCVQETQAHELVWIGN